MGGAFGARCHRCCAGRRCPRVRSRGWWDGSKRCLASGAAGRWPTGLAVPIAPVLRMASNRNWRMQLPLAILLAIILNLIAFAIIISNSDGLLPSGALACGLTPIAALATLIVSLSLLRRTDPDPNANPMQRRWLRLSLLAIPALQILMITTLVLIAPALCNTGIRTCTDQ